MTLVPRPAALGLGIALAGLGGIGLFVAFHNLPPDVANFPALLGYLQAQVKGDTTGVVTPAAPAAAAAPDGRV